MNKTFKILSVLIITAAVHPLLAQSESRVEYSMMYSQALALKESFAVYLPEGYDESTVHYPVVYFLNPRDNDWFNQYLSGRKGKSLKDIADSLIAANQTGKMILVVPGYISLAINMLRTDLATGHIEQTGKYEDYFIDELIPYIDAHYRTIPDRMHRGIDGFELGGYTSVRTGLKHPELFSSVGSYDSPFMWPNLDNPITPEKGDDQFWMSPETDAIFGPVFDAPRNVSYMLNNSSTNILVSADDSNLEKIRSVRFHIQASNPLGLDIYEMNHCNSRLGRNTWFINVLASKGISNSFDDLTLTAGSTSEWKYADLHAAQSLVKHWETFQNVTSITEEERPPSTVELSENYPNPFNPSTKIAFSLERPAYVILEVFNLAGQKVATLAHGEYAAGQHQVTFNADGLASGCYIYRLKTTNFVDIKRMTLVR